jgi:hypothetical protein
VIDARKRQRIPVLPLEAPLEVVQAPADAQHSESTATERALAKLRRLGLL